MKNGMQSIWRERGLTLVVAMLLIFSLVGCASDYQPAKAGHSEAQYAALARQVFEETNVLRSRPGQYREILKSHRQRYSGKVYRPKNSSLAIMTQEGVAALDEAVQVMSGQAVLPVLAWSDELAAQAHAHVRDTGVKGVVGHEGSNGESFVQRINPLLKNKKYGGFAENISYGPERGRDVVIQQMIDDGVPDRGHRKNLLKEQLRYSGVACGYHRRYAVMCVAIYAYGHNKP